jgi:hypothetical protein
VDGAKKNGAFFSTHEKLFPKFLLVGFEIPASPAEGNEKFPAALRREFSEILQQEQRVIVS